MPYKIPEEPQEHCDFCGENPDFGFDMEWDAVLCWLCHLSQNTQQFIYRNRLIKSLPREFGAFSNVLMWKDMF